MADTHAFKHEPRRYLTDKARARLFLDAGGKCSACTRKIRIGEVWIADHIQALENAGTNAPDNWQVLCPNCDKTKTAKDHGVAAKGRDVATSLIVPTSQRRSKGAPIPGSRRSKFKKKMDGSVERR